MILKQLDLNGFKDWFLPSKDLLNLMYTNLHRKGNSGFAADWYWSSTEADIYYVWLQHFVSGSQYTSDKLSTLRVRAVRAF